MHTTHGPQKIWHSVVRPLSKKVTIWHLVHVKGVNWISTVVHHSLRVNACLALHYGVVYLIEVVLSISINTGCLRVVVHIGWLVILGSIYPRGSCRSPTHLRLKVMWMISWVLLHAGVTKSKWILRAIEICILQVVDQKW
jgi:hypothetical protein